jgi:tetratricopeptide (TPR) repeat protein
MVREIEFEFREDTAGGGSFVAAGNVLGTLRDHINRGELEPAAKLLASCTNTLGEELLADVLAGASTRAMRATGEVFALARDYRRSAICSERVGDLERASALYEAAYDYDKAIALRLQGGNKLKAAELCDRQGQSARAGELYYEIGEFLRAAESWERAGALLNAGKLYVKAAQWERALEVLQGIGADSPDFFGAAFLLGQLQERSGAAELAAQHYAAALRGRPLDAQSVEVYYRLASLLGKMGAVDKARQLFTRIAAFKPGFRDVAAQLGALGNATEKAPPSLSLDDAATAKHASVIAVDPDFEYVRALPLFEQLSLDELKVVRGELQRLAFRPGETIIKQGSPGASLFIVLRGNVQVSMRAPSGVTQVLAELGAGAHLGEMSLLDDAPTSADVIATSEVATFRLSRERFAQLLAANERIALRFYRAFAGDLAQRLRETNRKLQA